MKRDELVKRELSRTLKEMSKSQALSSVTVSALTDKCGFSRGTFTIISSISTTLSTGPLRRI